MSNGVTFVCDGGDTFKKVIRSRINHYFEENQLSRHWNLAMLFKTVLLLSVYIGAYALFLKGHLNAASTLGVALILGFAVAGIGLNIAHDACHGAYSSSHFVNECLSHSFTILGVHAYNWRITHNIIHHTYTNVPYADADLHPVPFLRYFDIDQEKKGYHKYQHIYAYALYCLATIVWVFYKDYLHISRDTHVGYQKRPVPKIEYFYLIAGKLFHYTLFLVVPIFVAHITVWLVLLNFVVMHVVAGATLAGIFSVGHMVDGLEMPRFDENKIVHDGWAAHQLKTTANFSNKNKLLTWAVGGLNHQIEHHLFPRVCHVHYPAIAKIVKSTAAEFQLPYLEFASFRSAQAAHVRFLKRYGALDNVHRE